MSVGLDPRPELDPALTRGFRPRRLFFHGPPWNPVGYDVALGWLEFGMTSVDGAGRSEVEIVNACGVTVASHVVER